MLKPMRLKTIHVATQKLETIKNQNGYQVRSLPDTFLNNVK